MDYPFKNVKISKPSIFSSDTYWKYKNISSKYSPPKILLFCYSDSLYELIIKEYKNTKVTGFFGDLRIFKKFKYDIGILGRFGIGGPVTAVLTEDLKKWGVKMIISIGLGSSLQSDVKIGDLILVERAFRDEGTSYHYEPASNYSFSSVNLFNSIYNHSLKQQVQIHKGAVWTTDAIYRETKDEILIYQSEGMLAVEMECASLFSVCNYCSIQCASIICISDSVATLNWEFKNNLDELNDSFLEFIKNLLEYLHNELI